MKKPVIAIRLALFMVVAITAAAPAFAAPDDSIVSQQTRTYMGNTTPLMTQEMWVIDQAVWMSSGRTTALIRFDLGKRFYLNPAQKHYYEESLAGTSAADQAVPERIQEAGWNYVPAKPAAQPPSKPALHSTPLRAAAEKGIGAPAGKSLVLSLGGGPVFLPAWEATSTYNRYLYPYVVLQSLTESNTLTLSLKPPTGVGLGLGLTYFLSPSLGIQFRIDLMPNRPIVDGLNEYTMTWKWLTSSTLYSLDPSPTWPIVGHLRAHPVSLGLLARLPAVSRIQPYFQAGVAYFLCRLKAESQIGYAQTWVEDPYQYVDYFTLPVSIDEFFNGLGFMGGAGLEWLLGSKTAVFVQADYFAGPSQEVGWAVEPGTYSAHFSSMTLSIDENNARIIRSYIPTFTVKVGSLFRILAGIKIIL